MRCYKVLALSAMVSMSVGGYSYAKSTQYPITIMSCGHSLTFDKAPERIVGIGQGSVEILYSLGLADKVQGTALWVSPVLEEFKEINEKIEVLANNETSFESILEKKPDIVTNQFQWQIGPAGVVAGVEQFEELGIPVYTSPTDCVGKDNSDGDGIRKQAFSMDLIYQEISELAEIFDVQDKGADLVAQLKDREQKAKDKVGKLSKNTSAVFWFSSADAESDPYVAGTQGAAAYIMNTLGIDNIIAGDAEWPAVSWETIVRADPTYIVAGEMNRRRFPLDDIKVKIEFLENDPVLQLMPAVQNKNIIKMQSHFMNPTIRTIEGLEIMADAISKANN